MSESFFGSGTIFIDRFDEQGGKTGYIEIGTGKSLSLKSSGELKQLTSRKPGSYGQVIASVGIPGKTELKIGHSDFDAENMAMAFLGEVKDLNQSSGTLTAKEILIPKAGKWVELGFRNFESSGFLVKDASGSALDLDADYVVNYEYGLIKALSSGDITDGEKIKITAKYNAISKKRVLGATKPIIKAAIRFEGVNMENGKKCTVYIWKTTLQPDTDIDFLSEDFLETSLSGSPEVVEGKESTFEIHYG